MGSRALHVVSEVSCIYLYFPGAFLATTLFPAQSEAVYTYQISAYPDALVYLIAIATAGNVLGAILNWVLGRFFTQFSWEAGFLFLLVS